jgi:histidine triad (HIT) family protein
MYSPAAWLTALARNTERWMTETACIFCRIADGEAPAHIVWQDSEHVAFLDRSPVTEGHVLLIPRTHVTTIYDLDPPAYARLFERVRVLAPPVAQAASAPRTALAIEGYGVAHAHVHLVPVWRAGELDPCRQAPAREASLQAAATRLRAVFAAPAG